MKDFRDKSRQLIHIDQKKANRMAEVSKLPDIAELGDPVYYNGSVYFYIRDRWRRFIPDIILL